MPTKRLNHRKFKSDSARHISSAKLSSSVSYIHHAVPTSHSGRAVDSVNFFRAVSNRQQNNHNRCKCCTLPCEAAVRKGHTNGFTNECIRFIRNPRCVPTRTKCLQAPLQRLHRLALLIIAQQQAIFQRPLTKI